VCEWPPQLHFILWPFAWLNHTVIYYTGEIKLLSGLKQHPWCAGGRAEGWMREEEVGRMGTIKYLPPLIFSGELGCLPNFLIDFILLEGRVPQGVIMPCKVF
jgi:hypothetical protein